MFALTFRLLLLGLLVLIVVAVPANDPAGRRDWRAFQAAQGNTLDLLDRQMQSLFAPRALDWRSATGFAVACPLFRRRQSCRRASRRGYPAVGPR